MKQLVHAILLLIDLLMMPFVYPSAVVLKAVRRIGMHRLPFCKSALMTVGVFPIRNHYYEPLFDMRGLSLPLDRARDLPGIDWNLPEQLRLLESFHFNDELLGIPDSPQDDHSFHFNNGSFGSGDAEYWYNLIRAKKPKRIFEIGSGNSTLMARRAILRNQEESPGYECKHVCIEPYEAPWLEKTGVLVVRRRVQDVGSTFFSELGENDILFIDSSHIIRPQGDVVVEYLQILPSLNRGVIVHVHDIFSPRDYLEQWVVDEVKLWNEQYLLEAFLTSNKGWNILGALNYLHHACYDQLKAKCPYLTPEREPGSFYMEKVG